MSPSEGQVDYALLTRSPLRLIEASFHRSSFDLHVLSTPPAFVLSQDQTLRQKYPQTSKTGRRTITKHISRLAHQKVNKSKQTTTQPPLTQHPRKDTKQTETRTAIQTNMASKFTNTLLSSQTSHALAPSAFWPSGRGATCETLLG